MVQSERWLQVKIRGIFLHYLKNDRFPSWVQVNNTGPFASTEKLLYCTVVTGEFCFLLVLWRYDRDNTPLRLFMLTEYTEPYNQPFLSIYLHEKDRLLHGSHEHKFYAQERTCISPQKMSWPVWSWSIDVTSLSNNNLDIARPVLKLNTW